MSPETTPDGPRVRRERGNQRPPVGGVSPATAARDWGVQPIERSKLRRPQETEEASMTRRRSDFYWSRALQFGQWPPSVPNSSNRMSQEGQFKSTGNHFLTRVATAPRIPAARVKKPIKTKATRSPK